MILRPLEGKALRAVGQDAAIVALEGSVRSGKTFASLLAWLRFIRQGPRGRLLMTGRTERTVIDNLIVPLEGMLGPQRVQLNRGTSMVRILGRPVSIVGANNEAAVTKIQGSTLAGAYVDEASALPESFFAMLYSRLSVAGARMWLTSNPEGPAHWLKVNWLDRARLWIDREGVEHQNESEDAIDLVRISFKLEDNPNLPPDYVERIRAAYTGLWRRRYILGEWCIAAGAVYQAWEPARHVVKELPAIARVVAVGIDYGTTHPTRGYLLGLSAEADPRLVLLDEWAPAAATDAELSRDLRSWLSTRPAAWQEPEWVCVDPAAASFKLQLRQDGISRVMNATSHILAGVCLIESLLAADRLIVSESCRELIRKLPGYSWDPKATARGEDLPLKTEDDEADAMRYAIVSTRPVWAPYVAVTLPLEDG